MTVDQEKIEQQFLQQQQQQQILHNQIKTLQQQIANQDVKLQGIKTTLFNLSPDQIIRNFNEIQAFSGEDTYKLKSFLKSIVDAESLCGNNNEELKQYCLRKLINTKIIGNARGTIMEIPDNQRTWENVIKQLKLRYRPKNTIHQLLYNAKEIKVFNLKDIFNKLNKCKSECSEKCDFDDEDNFTYFSIDRELVQILKSKLIPLVQLQIDTTKSLFELDNILCKSEIYLSEDIIKLEFKMNRNKELNYKTNKTYSQNNNYFRNNNVNSNDKKEFGNSNNNSYNNNKDKPGQFRSQDYRNNSGQFRSQDYRNNSGQFRSQDYRNNSGQFRKQDYRNNGNNSGQYRQQFNTTGQYRSNNQRPEPMEVDNINQINPLNEEVNFIEPTPSTSYR